MSTEFRRAERLLETAIEARVGVRLTVPECAALLGELKSRRVAATATCGAAWDEHTACALPPGHKGWHASNPWYDTGRGEPHAGGTWTPGRHHAQRQATS